MLVLRSHESTPPRPIPFATLPWLHYHSFMRFDDFVMVTSYEDAKQMALESVAAALASLAAKADVATSCEAVIVRWFDANLDTLATLIVNVRIGRPSGRFVFCVTWPSVGREPTEAVVAAKAASEAAMVAMEKKVYFAEARARVAGVKDWVAAAGAGRSPC